jgi:hypothetical protein
MFGENLRSWLANPFLAALIGIVAGTAIALVNRFGAGFMSPDDDTGAGYGMALGLITAGLFVAAGLLFAYSALAPAAIAPFGIGLVGSLLVVTVLALLPAMRRVRAGDKGR